MNSDIAIINDTHFGIRNDSIYFLDKSLEYFETVVFPYIIKNDIKSIQSEFFINIVRHRFFVKTKIESFIFKQ